MEEIRNIKDCERDRYSFAYAVENRPTHPERRGTTYFIIRHEPTKILLFFFIGVRKGRVFQSRFDPDFIGVDADPKGDCLVAAEQFLGEDIAEGVAVRRDNVTLDDVANAALKLIYTNETPRVPPADAARASFKADLFVHLERGYLKLKREEEEKS